MATRALRILAAVLTLQVAVLPRAAHTDNLAPDAVKAGFVYNFTKFVEWPSGVLPAGGSMQLCVLGQALDGRLVPLHGRISQGREIRVRNVSAGSDLTSCHVLFVAESEERRMGSVLNAVSGNPVLTISDIGDFAESGGMIGLAVRNEKVTFTVNLPATRAAGLRTSAQLLRLGRVLQ